MRDVCGQTLAAMLAGSLAFAGGAAGVMAEDDDGSSLAQAKGSPAYADRGRLGPQAMVEEALESKSPLPPQPVAAEVKGLTVTGTVVSIDREARTVILRDDIGEEMTVQIPADATNFSRLKEGDRMDVHVVQPLELAPPTQ